MKIRYYTNEEIEKRKKQFVKYVENSNLWQGVISFNNDYLNSNITIIELEKELSKQLNSTQSYISKRHKKILSIIKENLVY